MRPFHFHIAFVLLASAPVSGQLLVEMRQVQTDRQSTEAVIVAASLVPDGPSASLALVAGERIVAMSGGRLAVVRRFPVTFPTPRTSVTSSKALEEPLSWSDGLLGSIRRDTAAAPIEGVRLVDVAPRGDVIAATLEVVMAIVDPVRRTTVIVAERRVRLDHDLLPSAAFRVWGTSVAGPIVHRTVVRPSSSVFAAGQEWYRSEITETGMYRFDRTYFLTAGVSSEALADIRRLRLYGNDGAPVPENLASMRPVGLQEIPRLIHDTNGNGALDDGESVVVYGRSVRHWRYDPLGRSYQHTINPYSERNAILFTFDPSAFGKEMDSVQSVAGPAAVVPHVLERIAVDQDRVNFVNSGRRWVGEPFDINDNSSVYVTMLHGLVPATPISYRAVFFSRSGTVDTFRVTENDRPVLGPVLMFTSDVSSVDQIFNYAYESPAQSFQHPGSLPENRSVLRFSFGTRNQSARGWLDWFEIFYQRSLSAKDDRLLFPSPDTSAVLEYTVRNLSSRSVLVADVSNTSDVRRVAGVEFDDADASLCRFRLPHTAVAVREFAVVGANGYLTPPAPKKVPAPTLRSMSDPVSFLILAPREFLEEAERLRAHRERQDSLRTLVVDVESVYNEFGGGIPDPIAIRDFLAYARKQYAGPVRYVLFFGNGHYDYRNIATSARSWIPPYETEESNFQINSYASDDFYAMLDAGSPRISLAIGRLPGRTLADMRTMVDKIIRHETSAPLDPWRNRITFVADDGQTSTNPFEGSLHTAQAENLARSYTPASFEQRKIYLVEYPTVNSASGRRKPLANEAIIDAFNRGSVVLNFTGHGNPRLWTHEAVFTREASIPRLVNRDRLTFLVAATCNFAQWDNPSEQSAGELLLTMDQGGAIGVVTATRSVYSFDNAELNYVLYSYLFGRDSTGASVRVGDAFYAMKQIRYGTNDQKYHLLGDPTSRLARPQGAAAIDSVNGLSTASVAVIPSLGRATVAGSVRNGLGAVRTDFNGRGLLELFDSKRFVTVAEWGGYAFEVQGSVLYRGEVSVTGGMFQAQVPVPKDVTFGSRARLALYATSGTTDAVGVTEQVTISGTDSTASADTTGPVIGITLGADDFRPGDVVPPDPLLIVRLSDASGVNTSTVGIGHRLEAELAEDGRIVDLGEVYRGDLDTYQSGRAVTQLTGLSEGRHTVRVRAWDIRNNSSSSETVFEVRAGSDVDLFQVTNFPNPMTDGTVFTFQRTSGTAVSVEVRIYTVAGRLVQRLEVAQVSDQFVRVAWDGRDREGASLANGVYLYKVIARTLDRSHSQEYIGKLAVVR